MGDLVLLLTCPNGTSIALHQQGGGGTYLGDPIDNDDFDPVPGICYTYCFNDHPDHGTWLACSQNGITPNVIPASDGGVSLAPGSYTPVDSLSNLDGCPVNGIWTFSIVDLFALDNGFLCSWSIGLQDLPSASINPLGPVLGLTDPDSSFWSGAGILNDPENVGAAMFTPSGAGTQQFTHTVIDSYGCSYDTTVTIAVVPIDAPVVSPGDEDGELCASNAFPATYTWYLNGVPSGDTTDCWIPTEPGLVTVVATDANGCTAFTDILTTAISVPEGAPFSIQIRPSADRHVVVLMDVPDDRAVRLQLLDVSGRVVTERTISPSDRHVEARLGAHLASGSYILHATQAGRQVVERVVVP